MTQEMTCRQCETINPMVYTEPNNGSCLCLDCGEKTKQDVRTIHFPANTGLKPREFCAVDRRALKYFRAVESRNYPKQAEIERELRGCPLYFTTGELDEEYSNGKMLDGCTIK